jgi:hypothetical protein
MALTFTFVCLPGNPSADGWGWAHVGMCCSHGDLEMPIGFQAFTQAGLWPLFRAFPFAPGAPSMMRGRP